MVNKFTLSGFFIVLLLVLCMIFYGKDYGTEVANNLFDFFGVIINAMTGQISFKNLFGTAEIYGFTMLIMSILAAVRSNFEPGTFGDGFFEKNIVYGTIINTIIFSMLISLMGLLRTVTPNWLNVIGRILGVCYLVVIIYWEIKVLLSLLGTGIFISVVTLFFPSGWFHWFMENVVLMIWLICCSFLPNIIASNKLDALLEGDEVDI